MTYVAITSFRDYACSEVDRVRHLTGYEADRFLVAYKRIKGWEPKEGDIIDGVRIDRIGSEDCAA